MTQYRKKPVVIEAMQLPLGRNADVDHQADIMGWMNNGGLRAGEDITIDEYGWHIGTLEGVMRADWSDWIIKGVEGEFYPCKPDIFDKTYDPVDTPSEIGTV